MKYLLWMAAGLMLLSSTACSHSKPKPLVPLELAYGINQQAVEANQQGRQAYQAGQIAEAKQYFAQAVKAAPSSGHARYNYALALNALGETDKARQEFIEAANLEPGDKIIWDSPALRPFGSPQAPKAANKEHPYGTQRPTIGSGPR